MNPTPCARRALNQGGQRRSESGSKRGLGTEPYTLCTQGFESGRAEKKRKWVEKRFAKKKGKEMGEGGGSRGGVDQAKVREVEKLFGM